MSILGSSALEKHLSEASHTPTPGSDADINNGQGPEGVRFHDTTDSDTLRLIVRGALRDICSMRRLKLFQ